MVSTFSTISSSNNHVTISIEQMTQKIRREEKSRYKYETVVNRMNALWIESKNQRTKRMKDFDNWNEMKWNEEKKKKKKMRDTNVEGAGTAAPGAGPPGAGPPRRGGRPAIFFQMKRVFYTGVPWWWWALLLSVMFCCLLLVSKRREDAKAKEKWDLSTRAKADRRKSFGVLSDFFLTSITLLHNVIGMQDSARLLKSSFVEYFQYMLLHLENIES